MYSLWYLWVVTIKSDPHNLSSSDVIMIIWDKIGELSDVPNLLGISGQYAWDIEFRNYWINFWLTNSCFLAQSRTWSIQCLEPYILKILTHGNILESWTQVPSSSLHFVHFVATFFFFQICPPVSIGLVFEHSAFLTTVLHVWIWTFIFSESKITFAWKIPCNFGKNV